MVFPQTSSSCSDWISRFFVSLFSFFLRQVFSPSGGLRTADAVWFTDFKANWGNAVVILALNKSNELDLFVSLIKSCLNCPFFHNVVQEATVMKRRDSSRSGSLWWTRRTLWYADRTHWSCCKTSHTHTHRRIHTHRQIHTCFYLFLFVLTCLIIIVSAAKRSRTWRGGLSSWTENSESWWL